MTVFPVCLAPAVPQHLHRVQHMVGRCSEMIRWLRTSALGLHVSSLGVTAHLKGSVSLLDHAQGLSLGQALLLVTTGLRGVFGERGPAQVKGSLMAQLTRPTLPIPGPAERHRAGLDWLVT